jgi:hypothetical protein
MHWTFAQTADRLDILITEIFADPVPKVGLPNSEFLELRNVSKKTISLDKWKITDGNSTAIISGSFQLPPDSIVIICSRSVATDYASFGRTIGISGFPTLDNEGDDIILLSPEGRTIHAVAYRSSWYGNAIKSDGGWSLEMIDTGLPCLGRENWSSSTDPSGGSPGKRNSIAATLKDIVPPSLLRTYTKDSLNIFAVFDESLDSISASFINRFDIDRGIGNPVTVTPLPPFYNVVRMKLGKPMIHMTTYQLTVRDLRDCAGNLIPTPLSAATGIPQSAAPGQLRINEILFNPKSGGADYVEILNRGPGLLDASALYIGNRNSAGMNANLNKCSSEPFLIFPGDHLTLTEDPGSVEQHFTVKKTGLLLGLSYMPSYPDDKGTVVLLDDKGLELDVFSYEEDFHFPLLSNREGVALERIDPKSPTQDRSNWYSASSDAGYGTPTMLNSQFRRSDTIAGNIFISPVIFSPDQDGHDDQLTVQYNFPMQGYTCSIIIFDQAGRPVRYLSRNNLCGINGYYRWNGLDERNNRLPAGAYYLIAEFFNLEGKRKIIRKAIVLAYRI